MKRKVLLAMTLLSATVVTGGAPLTVYAAEAEPVRIWSGRCYKVFVGQGMESLTEVLNELGCILGSTTKPCPDNGTTDTPEQEAPELEIPDFETPEVETPDIDVPAPEAPKPPVTEKPDTSKPEIETPEQGTLSYAEQVVKLVNEERAKAGLPALNVMTDLTAAANVRAVEIKQSFSHTRPNGTSFSTAIKEQGVSFRGSGENIAWGQKTPQQVMNGWMNSDGHRANILNKNFKNIGVGYYQDEKGTNYWVQLFTY